MAIKVPSKVVVAGSFTAAALALSVTVISQWEGMYTHAYRDVIGVPTICLGHIEDVHMGDTMTKAECAQLLLDDLPRYEAQVEKCVTVAMPPHRAAAILSFTYNVGGGNLCKSSVVRKLNAGDVAGACEALMLYDRAGGKVWPGLENRRKFERAWCLRED